MIFIINKKKTYAYIFTIQYCLEVYEHYALFYVINVTNI